MGNSDSIPVISGLGKVLVAPFKLVGNSVYTVGGLFTGDGEQFKKGLSGMANSVFDVPSGACQTVTDIITSPKYLFSDSEKHGVSKVIDGATSIPAGIIEIADDTIEALRPGEAGYFSSSKNNNNNQSKNENNVIQNNNKSTTDNNNKQNNNASPKSNSIIENTPIAYDLEIIDDPSTLPLPFGKEPQTTSPEEEKPAPAPQVIPPVKEAPTPTPQVVPPVEETPAPAPQVIPPNDSDKDDDEEKPIGFWDKLKNHFKNNWGKYAIAAGVLIVGILLFKNRNAIKSLFKKTANKTTAPTVKAKPATIQPPKTKSIETTSRLSETIDASFSKNLSGKSAEDSAAVFIQAEPLKNRSIETTSKLSETIDASFSKNLSGKSAEDSAKILETLTETTSPAATEVLSTATVTGSRGTYLDNIEWVMDYKNTMNNSAFNSLHLNNTQMYNLGQIMTTQKGNALTTSLQSFFKSLGLTQRDRSSIISSIMAYVS